MKAAKWPLIGRPERVAKAQRDFDVSPPPWHLPVVDLRYIAEDVDLEYE
jgi:hypothetical protein